MDRFECVLSNTVLIFDGNNYVLWSNRMQTYLFDIGVDVWLSIENGYKPSKNPPSDPDEKKTCKCNYKARHNILNALSPTI